MYKVMHVSIPTDQHHPYYYSSKIKSGGGGKKGRLKMTSYDQKWLGFDDPDKIIFFWVPWISELLVKESEILVMK